MDVGTTLRTAREHRGIPLPRMAALTKIPIGILRALETNAFDRIPTGIFLRGYLRAYAREVGLEPEALVAQFLAETEPPPTIGLPTDEPAVDDGLEPMETDPDLAEPSRADWGYVLIVAALLIGFVSMNRSGTPDGPDAVSAVSAPLPAPTIADAGVQPMLAAAEERAVATTGVGLRIELQAQGLCWVRAAVDGEVVLERLLQPGERQLLDADTDIVLRVGEPGALLHTVNGRPGEPLGRPGMPVTIRFTTEGRHILAS
jgi:cytoskeletal protein RodZ